VCVDQLVDQIYEDRLIKQDLHSFVTRVPILCAYFRTPLFHTTQANYYKMVVKAFEQRPNHAEIPWVTTPAIYAVEFPTGAPIIAQIATIDNSTAKYCGIDGHHQPTTTSIQTQDYIYLHQITYVPFPPWEPWETPIDSSTDR
jgi:hypothetical protein